MNNLENNIEDLDLNMIYSSHEIQNQIKALKNMRIKKTMKKIIKIQKIKKKKRKIKRRN